MWHQCYIPTSLEKTSTSLMLFGIHEGIMKIPSQNNNYILRKLFRLNIHPQNLALIFFHKIKSMNVFDADFSVMHNCIPLKMKWVGNGEMCFRKLCSVLMSTSFGQVMWPFLKQATYLQQGTSPRRTWHGNFNIQRVTAASTQHRQLPPEQRPPSPEPPTMTPMASGSWQRANGTEGH